MLGERHLSLSCVLVAKPVLYKLAPEIPVQNRSPSSAVNLLSLNGPVICNGLVISKWTRHLHQKRWKLASLLVSQCWPLSSKVNHISLSRLLDPPIVPTVRAGSLFSPAVCREKPAVHIDSPLCLRCLLFLSISTEQPSSGKPRPRRMRA